MASTLLLLCDAPRNVLVRPRHSWWVTLIPAKQEARAHERQDRDSYACEGRLFFMERPMGRVQRFLRTTRREWTDAHPCGGGFLRFARPCALSVPSQHYPN